MKTKNAAPEIPFALIYRALPNLPAELVKAGIEVALKGVIRKVPEMIPAVKAWVETELAAAKKAQKKRNDLAVSVAALQAKARRIAAEKQAEFAVQRAWNRAGYERFACELRCGLLAGEVGRDKAANIYESEWPAQAGNTYCETNNYYELGAGRE